MKKYRIALDSTVYVNANDYHEAIMKYTKAFKKVDNFLKNEDEDLEFIRYILTAKECDYNE